MFILDSFQFIWGGISGSSNEIPCGLPIWRYGLWNTQDGWKRLRFVYLFCVSPVQNISNYYMAESACGKIKRILCFNWLPEWAIWDFAGFPTLELLENSLSCDKFFTDQVSVVKTTGCWPRVFFSSVYKSAKKNLANIQLFWPHTWSVTHIIILLNARTWEILV